MRKRILFPLVLFLFLSSALSIVGGGGDYSVDVVGDYLVINEPDFTTTILESTVFGGSRGYAVLTVTSKTNGTKVSLVGAENTASELGFGGVRRYIDMNFVVNDYNVSNVVISCDSVVEGNVIEWDANFNPTKYNGTCNSDSLGLLSGVLNIPLDLDGNYVSSVPCKEIDTENNTCVFENWDLTGNHLEVRDTLGDFSTGDTDVLDAGESKDYYLYFEVTDKGAFKFDAVLYVDGVEYRIDPFISGTDFAAAQDLNYTGVRSGGFNGSFFDGNVSITGELDFNKQKTYPGDYDVNLIAYWKFNDNNGTHTLDETSNNNDGLLTGGADTNALGLWDTNAGFFDGVDDFSIIEDSDSLDFSSGEQITIIAWARFAGLAGSFDYLVSKRATGGRTQYTFRGRASGTRLSFLLHNGPFDEWLSTGVAFSVGVWHHFAVTHTYGTGASTKVYVDGVPEAGSWVTGTGNRVPGPDAIDLGIGATSTGDQPFKGLINEVKIYNRTLTASEVAADYTAWMNAHYYSEVFDANVVVDWNAIQWTENVNAIYTDIRFQVRSCNDANCSTGGEFVGGPDGNVNNYFTLGNFFHELPTNIDNNRYFQYKAYLDTNTVTVYPYLADVNIEFLTIPPLPAVIDINIVAIDGNPIADGLPEFSFDVDGNLTIDFNVIDSNGLLVDLNYSTTNVEGTGTVIIEDLNLMNLPANCDDLNFENSTRCDWDWDIDGVADNNYFILGLVTSDSNSAFKASALSFRVNPVPPPAPLQPEFRFTNDTNNTRMQIQGGLEVTADLNVTENSLAIDGNWLASSPNGTWFTCGVNDSGSVICSER